ncbi:MAG TPA: TAXI family TRAP transporter solute-binding subunit [Rhizomicrobium sp.]|nr:TAXI family TRAP transporter solute-binding subunit [Rhizomicrobium sp.]
MTRRVASAFGLGGVLALILAMALGLGADQSWAQRISFVIATGPTGGTYFPIGEAIAGIISHPPGVDRCDTPGVCGPIGLIASARTSAGAISNVMAVNAGYVDSGLAQSDVVADAVAGKGAFRKTGALKHLRIIAALFPEDVHVIVAKRAHVDSIAALRGKRVSIGDVNSGTIVTARAVLAAYGLSEWRIRASHLPSDAAADALDRGKLDAFFFVGGAPVGLIADLIARGRAVLLPIDGKARERLLAANSSFSADVIAAGTYSGATATQTVSVRALWVVNENASGDVVYGVTKALFHPLNRALLYQSHPSATAIRLESATDKMPAPLHPGAARFYQEIRRPPHIDRT